MTPAILFEYIAATGAGLFVCALLAGGGCILYFAGRGLITGSAPKSRP